MICELKRINNNYERQCYFTRKQSHYCETNNKTFISFKQTAAVAPKETITHHFFVSGIGQKKTVDAAKICGGAENVVKTELSKHS